MLSIIITLFLSTIPPLFANPLQTTPPPLLTNTTFDGLSTIPPPPNDTTTNLTIPHHMGCFRQSNPPTLLPTTKTDCEAVLDAWVAGQDLHEPRTFSRMSSYHIQDIKLPITRHYGTCVIQLNMPSEYEEDTMSLAEVYAGIMGPDGLVKRCLGVESPLGGMMRLGPRRLMFVVVRGRGQPEGLEES